MSAIWTLRLAGRSLTIEVSDGTPLSQSRPELLVFPPDAGRYLLLELLARAA